MLDDDHIDGIHALVGDQIKGEPRNANQNEEVHNFDKFEKDAKRQLYPGCIDYTILKFVIKMLNAKVMTNLSNKELDMILELLIKLLLKGNFVLRSTYEPKKILCDLAWVCHTSIFMHVKMIIHYFGRKMKTLINDRYLWYSVRRILVRVFLVLC